MKTNLIKKTIAARLGQHQAGKAQLPLTTRLRQHYVCDFGTSSTPEISDDVFDLPLSTWNVATLDYDLITTEIAVMNLLSHAMLTVAAELTQIWADKMLEPIDPASYKTAKLIINQMQTLQQAIIQYRQNREKLFGTSLLLRDHVEDKKLAEKPSSGK